MSLQDLCNQSFERLQTSLSRVSEKLGVRLKIGSESAIRIRRRQFLLGGCLAIGIVAFTYGVMTVLFDQGIPQKQNEAHKTVETNITTATNLTRMDEMRWYNLDAALKSLSEQVSDMKKAVYEEGQNAASTANTEKTAGNSNEREAAENTQNQEGFDDGSSTNESYTHDSRFDEIMERLSQLEAQKETEQVLPYQNPQNPHPQTSVEGETQDGRVIQKLSLNLNEHPTNLKTVETTIPAGAFAKTVLLSGLDASSAMNASSDPRPMLLRIIDHGTLPRRFQSDLKDCQCTAGAYGDLSSERVYARLEKLTCVERKTGEIIETQVSGYVAGSDGKAGIRGVVASKDGQFLARSLMGGIFAGLSNVANPQNRRAQVNPFFGGGTVSGSGSQPSGPSIEENFMSGMGQGATTALDRLSQYYIDRAEQLQPVIQIAAGQVVDIVFTEGTFIGSQTIRSELEKSKDEHCKGDACVQNHQPITH